MRALGLAFADIVVYLGAMQAPTVLPGGQISKDRFNLAVLGHLIALAGLLTVFRLSLLVTFTFFLLGVGISAFASRGVRPMPRRLTKQELLILVGGMVAVLAILFVLGEIFGDRTVTNWPVHPLGYIVGWSTGFHAIRHLRSLASHLSRSPGVA